MIEYFIIENPGKTILMFIFLIGAFAAKFTYDYIKQEELYSIKIAAAGYDINDVDVFVDSIGSCRAAFLKSKGLRLQYEHFKNGETSNFIIQARQHKEVEDARTNGQVQGAAAATAVHMAIHSGR